MFFSVFSNFWNNAVHIFLLHVHKLAVVCLAENISFITSLSPDITSEVQNVLDVMFQLKN